MAVKLTTVNKFNVREEGKGAKRYCAAVKSAGTDTLKEITVSIEKASTVSGGDIRAVLYELVETMKHSLAEGRIIRLEDLGSFRISVKSDIAEDPTDIGPGSVRQAKIVFTPDAGLNRWLKQLKFEKL